MDDLDKQRDTLIRWENEIAETIGEVVYEAEARGIPMDGSWWDAVRIVARLEDPVE